MNESDNVIDLEMEKLIKDSNKALDGIEELVRESQNLPPAEQQAFLEETIKILQELSDQLEQVTK
jgi:hypothetical protein